MAKGTLTKWTCDMCENSISTPGTDMPSSWRRLKVTGWNEYYYQIFDACDTCTGLESKWKRFIKAFLKRNRK